MKVLLIDNFDSFVYNLAQCIGSLGAEPEVVRNDVDVDFLVSTNPDALVVSPGPGRPEEAGISIQAIRALAGRIPILGVCLGHQAIGVAYGANVVRAGKVMHGKTSEICHESAGVLSGLASPFVATRYHSLVIDPTSMPTELEVTAETRDGIVMAVRHREHQVEGVQFHPESVLTALGPRIIENFLAYLG